MDKKGQIYILSAVIIAFIIYVIFTPSNIIRKSSEPSNFYDIAKNFERESAHFLNALITSNDPIYDEFLEFTVLFTSFSKTKNPEAGLVYTFVYDDVLYIGNYAEDTLEVNAEGRRITVEGCLSDIDTSFSIGGLELEIPDVDLGHYRQCLVEVPLTYQLETIDLTLIEPDGSRTEFSADFGENNPDLMIVAKEKQGASRRIYEKDAFI
mgnify:CR=1 FL=1